MSKSRKFRGEVNYSFNKKKKPPTLKEREDPKADKAAKEVDKDPYEYFEWEEEGDFEKFDRKKW